MIEKKPVYTPQSQCMQIKKTPKEGDVEEETKPEETKPKKVQAKKHLTGKECRRLFLKRPIQVGSGRQFMLHCCILTEKIILLHFRRCDVCQLSPIKHYKRIPLLYRLESNR